MQPFCLSLQDRPLSFLLKVIRLSQCPKQGFPFMVLSLNVTHIVLNSLRRGYLDRSACKSLHHISLSKTLSPFYLSRAFRKRGAVLPVTNLYYGAVLHFIYERWKCEDLTLVDSGSLLKSKIAHYQQQNQHQTRILFFFKTSFLNLCRGRVELQRGRHAVHC